MKKLLWLSPLLAAIPLLAVTPQFWEIRTHDDFRRGKLTNLSLTSDDELILAPRFDTVFNTEQTLIWSAIADSKGNVYAGTGHDGKIYKVDPAGNGALLADLPELDVLALAVDSKDVLYAGTSPDGKVYKIEPGSAPKDFFDPDVKYIWSLVFDKQGRLLVGTGDKGVIYRVTPDGKGIPFYDTDETHIVSMAIDKDGNVIAGGDPKGYIYRISPEARAFVLYDSGMREVHSVAVAPNGTIYASVITGQPAIAPAAAPAATGNSSRSPETSITVTLGAAGAQDVQVIEPLDTVSTDTPRAQTRRSDGMAQSVVLEILTDGVVNTLWRSREEMVFSVLPHDGKLLFSTGEKGRIYSMEGGRNTTLLLESTEEQTTRLVEVGNRVYAASANIGKLFRVGDVLALSGTYESIVKDTESISSWGKLTWRADRPGLIELATRTGNTSSPDKTWSDWQTVDSSGATASPKARFVQWRASLKADRGTSPKLGPVKVPYLQQNFRPDVANVEALVSGVALQKVAVNAGNNPNPNDPVAVRAAARAGQPRIQPIPPRRVPQRGTQSFQWTATDKNQDTMNYDLYYRGENERTWKVLKKDLEDNFFTINSDTLPDGVYVVRVVATDEPSNPAELALKGEMESRPFSIDNTPPVVRMRLEALEKNRARIAIDAEDVTSTLTQAEIAIDTGEWRPVFPKDGIIDSKSESFSILSGDLVTGEHVIAFRTYDQNDNAGMGKLVVRIP